MRRLTSLSSCFQHKELQLRSSLSACLYINMSVNMAHQNGRDVTLSPEDQLRLFCLENSVKSVAVVDFSQCA